MGYVDYDEVEGGSGVAFNTGDLPATNVGFAAQDRIRALEAMLDQADQAYQEQSEKFRDLQEAYNRQSDIAEHLAAENIRLENIINAIRKAL